MQTLILNAKWGVHGSDDVWIDRRTKWGNPFRIGPDGNRTEVLTKYREWIANQPELLSALEELRGKRLICWCKPEECHGDHLVWLIYGERELQEWLNQ